MPAHRGVPTKNRIDLTGQRFGKLLVTGKTETKGKILFWECLCDCGSTTLKRAQPLRLGSTAYHCGCIPRKGWTTHAMYGTPTYLSWMSMKARCSDESNPDYGGRGITVCEQWLTFEGFFADMGERPKGMTLDRIKGDKGYEPGNCRWATRKVQSQNRSVAKDFEHKGVTKNLADWARDSGIKYHTLYDRVVTRGLSMAEALA